MNKDVYNTVIGTLAVDRRTVTFGTASSGLGGDTARPDSLAVPNVTAHPLAASVPITVLLCNSPLLCSFNVGIKGIVNLQQILQLQWMT